MICPAVKDNCTACDSEAPAGIAALAGAEAGMLVVDAAVVCVGRGVVVAETLVAVAVGVAVEVAVGTLVGVLDGTSVGDAAGSGVSVGAKVAVGGSSGVDDGSGEMTIATGVAVGATQLVKAINTPNQIKQYGKRFMILSWKTSTFED